MLTIGFKQTVVAFRECLRLKQTFLYLIFYFLMCVAFLKRWNVLLTKFAGETCSTLQCKLPPLCIWHAYSTTSRTVIGTLQNSVVSYSTLQLTLLLIVGIVAQGAGI